MPLAHFDGLAHKASVLAGIMQTLAIFILVILVLYLVARYVPPDEQENAFEFSCISTRQFLGHMTILVAFMLLACIWL